MPPCHIDVDPGTPLTSACMVCMHPLGSHLYPALLCLECVTEEAERLRVTLSVRTDLLDRVDHLAHAVVLVAQRLEQLEHHVGIRGAGHACWLGERPKPDGG